MSTAPMLAKWQFMGVPSAFRLMIQTTSLSKSHISSPATSTASSGDVILCPESNGASFTSLTDTTSSLNGFFPGIVFRTVDVHIRRLREKLEPDPANPEHILTKWGVGYYLANNT